MIAALFWKEWREQRAFAIAVLAFGFMGMVGASILIDPGGNSLGRWGPRELMPIAVAYLAGMVCGAMLFADEKEVGTMEFLDTLPSFRRRIWIAKALFGMVFSMGQCLLVGIAAVALGCYDMNTPALAWLIAPVLIGWLAFAWGAFGGATTNSTLAAVFQGAIICFVVGTILAVPLAAYTGGNTRNLGVTTLATYVYFMCWVLSGLLGSIYFFTQLDRERGAKLLRKPGQAPRRQGRKPGRFRALLWLALRQARLTAFIIYGVAACMAGLMCVPDAQPIFLWPSVTLMFGVVAGVTIFTEEQGKGITRFWSERRLPIGQLWFVKTLLHFLIAATASAGILLVLVLTDTRRPFRSELFNLLRQEQLRYLLLTLVYGFVCAHLLSLLFRKTIVAGLVSIIMAVTLAGALLPSLVGGGAQRWQIWLPALLLFITARLMLYPWAHGRIVTRTPLLRVGVGTAAAFLVLGAGLAYRVLEIPDMPDRLDEAQFVQRLPVYEANTGTLSRSAASQFNRVSKEAMHLVPPVHPGNPGGGYQNPVERLRQQGWSSEVVDLKPWLDKVFADPWLKYLDEAATKPTGIFDDPRDVDFLTPLETTQHFREMIIVLGARGMQRLVEGHPEEFIRLLRGGLAAVRATRNQCGWNTVVNSFLAERDLLAHVQPWLVHTKGRPDLLAALAGVLEQHQREIPTGSEQVFWADQVILRNTHTRVANWGSKLLRLNPNAAPGATDPGDAEADFVGVCWSFPWERLRRERIHRCLSQREPHTKTQWFSPMHLMDLYNRHATANIDMQDRLAITVRHVRQLQVALRRYHADQGRFPEGLTSLVPKYLPAVPLDPFGNKPFGYRLSLGEEIQLEEQPPRQFTSIELLACELFSEVGQPLGGALPYLYALQYFPPQRSTGNDFPMAEGRLPPDFGRNIPLTRRTIVLKPGDPVLWSVGRDGQDGGGKHAAANGGWGTSGNEDWLFFVP